MKIEINYLSDSMDCETCGTSYAEGAQVFKDGELWIDLAPVAHCFEVSHYDQTMVLTAILEKLGHTVVIDGQECSLTLP